MTRALEAIREDALNKQADKTKITNVDYIDRYRVQPDRFRKKNTADIYIYIYIYICSR